jgi:hypothetical protein
MPTIVPLGVAVPVHNYVPSSPTKTQVYGVITHYGEYNTGQLLFLFLFTHTLHKLSHLSLTQHGLQRCLSCNLKGLNGIAAAGVGLPSKVGYVVMDVSVGGPVHLLVKNTPLRLYEVDIVITFIVRYNVR